MNASKSLVDKNSLREKSFEKSNKNNATDEMTDEVKLKCWSCEGWSEI